MFNKNILITGGAGYIGSHLANFLNEKKLMFLLLMT
jgi:nucleoside-diphosphate-sugar epimerase